MLLLVYNPNDIHQPVYPIHGGVGEVVFCTTNLTTIPSPSWGHTHNSGWISPPKADLVAWLLVRIFAFLPLFRIIILKIHWLEKYDCESTFYCVCSFSYSLHTHTHRDLLTFFFALSLYWCLEYWSRRTRFVNIPVKAGSFDLFVSMFIFFAPSFSG